MTKRKLLFTILFLLIISSEVFLQNLRIDQIDPPNWWVGMKWNKVQLMVYGDNLNNIEAKFTGNALKVLKIHEVENSTYTFIDIEVPPDLTPGEYDLTLSKNGESETVAFEFSKREQRESGHQGFGRDDAIYLLMPDRFVNGDRSNDFIEGFIDSMQHIPTQQRKGGDLQGLINKLDYIKDLGFTTIWSTPVIENNTFRSYHGYATTNHYKIDPRLGTNELYKKFVEEAHMRGLKVILDHVANHVSNDHPWLGNLPTDDWLNGTIDDHIDANHNKMLYTDPHAHPSTVEEVYKGWFVKYMPDLNQKNSFVANHIIQNTLWWMEYAGIDGIREDTYPYAEPHFMAKWAEAIFEEYPNSNIVGEVWTGEPAFLAAYQGNPKIPAYVDTKLPSLTDFGLRDAFVEFLQGKSLYRIFSTIAKDHLYSDPNMLVTFVDNHDVGRGMFYADTNMARMKMVYHMLMTLRGIPQVFYGSEIGMIENDDHGTLRKKFPGGGWEDDTRDAFTAEGRTDYENEIFDYLKQLLHLRKDNKVIRQGKLTHFPIHDNVYVYFKSLGDEKVINIINDNDEAKEVDLGPYADIIGDTTKMENLKTGEEVGTKRITVLAKSASAFKLF